MSCIIKDYRQNMGGVDKFDQHLSYYGYPHSCKKWWKYYLFYYIEIAVYNTFIIFNKIMSICQLKDLRYIDFRLELVKQLTRWNPKVTIPMELTGI